MTNLRFLLLEANPQVAEQLAAVLKDGGIDAVLSRVDCRSSLMAALATDQFDLVLATNLPELDGSAVLAMVQQARPEVPCILLAEQWDEAAAIAAFETGAAGLVLKHRLERLVPCVQRALEQRQAHRDRQQTERLLVEQKQLLELIAAGRPLEDCLTAVCATIARLSPGTRACFLLADAQRQFFPRSVTPDFPPSLGQGLKDVPINDLCIGTCGEAVYQGQPITCADIIHDQRWSQAWRDLCIAHGILACHSQPVMDVAGLPLGSLMLSFNVARTPTAWEYQLANFGTQVASIVFERDRSQLAKGESEAKYRRLFDAIDEGFCICEMLFDDQGKPYDYRFLEVNPAFAALTGLEQPVGKTIRELVPDLEAFWVETYGKVVQTGEVVRFEQQSLVMNRWFDANAFPLGDPHSNQFGILFTNITQRKQAELAVRQSEARLRTVTANLPRAAVFIVSHDLRYLLAEGQALEQAGLTSESLVGRTVWEALESDLAQQYEPNFRQALRGEPFTVEHHSHNRDFISHGTPLYTEQGEIESALIISYDITDRKRAEQERERFLAIGSDLQVITGKNGYFQWVSPSFKYLLGWTPEEMTARPWTDFVHPDDVNPSLTETDSLFSGNQTYRFENRYRHRNGSYRWLLWNAESSQEDQVVYGTAIDITDLKSVEEQLRDSREFLNHITNVAPIILYVYDLDETCNVWSNNNLSLVLGYTPDEVLAMGANLLEALLHPEDIERYATHFQQLRQLQPEDVAEFEYRMRHQDGSWHWLSSREMVYAQRADGTVSQIVGAAHDITTRKRAEAELRQKNAILNVINESMPTPIFVKNRQGRFIYANPATLAVLGKSEAEVIGARDCDLYPNPADAVEVMANDRRIMETGQMEVVEETPDGVRTFLGMKVPYRNERGDVIGLIGISNDITERVQIERDREQVLQQEQAARQTAEEANRIKDEFLAVLSHELRSPLNPILGWASLLQKGKLDAARTQQALATIERNAKLQSELIEDLLDVSRILRGKLSLNVSPVNLVTVVQAALETVKLAAEAKSIQFETQLDPSVGMVLGDSTRLQQVLWNLLSNAVKFTPNGGRVTVSLAKLEAVTEPAANSLSGADSPHPHLSHSPSTQAQIVVTDTGTGIPRDFLPHIFDYFSQADSATTRQFGGLGLGLAIVRHLVELHGGTIQANSLGTGLGATFTVNLPLMPTQAMASHQSSFAKQLVNLNGIEVLVIDDDTDTRELIEFFLAEAGAKVRAAGSASEGLAQLLRSQPDVLLSDIGMPDMDGYMLMRQIRQLPPDQGGQVPAIALTAYAGEIDHQRAMAVGFQRHIAKPIDPEVLISAIATLKDYSD